MAAVRFDCESKFLEISFSPARARRELAVRARRACGLDTEASWLWPRWIFLRAAGFASLFAFYEWLRAGLALLGPGGVHPFYSPWLLTSLIWSGLVASAALLFNVGTRLAATVAWGCFLALLVPSARAHLGLPADELLAELLFVGMLLAPGGTRPGLGERPAPPPALLLARLTVVKLMMLGGLVRLLTPGAMGIGSMENARLEAAFPTVLAFYAHQLPWFVHAFEALVMNLAQLAAPVLLLFGGRRARLGGLGLWCAFELDLSACCNLGTFGPVAIALSAVLVDDAFLASLSKAFVVRRGVARAAARGLARRWGLRAVVTVSVISSLLAVFGVFAKRPSALADWHLGNAPAFQVGDARPRLHLVIDGSNDGGLNWREYRYVDLPQGLDSMAPPRAPLARRFDSLVYELSQGLGGQEWAHDLGVELGHEILRGGSRLLDLYRENPFPERHPYLARFGLFMYSFNSLAEFRGTGRYWRRELVGEPVAVIMIDRRTGRFKELNWNNDGRGEVKDPAAGH